MNKPRLLHFDWLICLAHAQMKNYFLVDVNYFLARYASFTVRMSIRIDANSMLLECERFIRAKRNYNASGHQRRYMFEVTSPFIELEGLRFKLITNSPYDYLDYVPTLQHIFLREPTLLDFERYVENFFPEHEEMYEDLCYFKIIKSLLPDDFRDFPNTIRNGKYYKQTTGDEYKIPICLIPVIEYQALEQHSSLYKVKSSCCSLDRTVIRIKLNTYFRSLMAVLQCSEGEVLDILVRKGVLPSRNFQLISTQKDLTIAYRRYQSCGNLESRLADRIREVEKKPFLIKPKYGSPNSNLCQALQCLFNFHPHYQETHDSLFVSTDVLGKGRLLDAIPNRKRKSQDSRRDQSNLPKKLLESDNILMTAMKLCVPELIVSELEPTNEEICLYDMPLIID